MNENQPDNTQIQTEEDGLAALASESEQTRLTAVQTLSRLSPMTETVLRRLEKQPRRMPARRSGKLPWQR